MIMKRKNTIFLVIFVAGIALFLTAILISSYAQKTLENPTGCSLCHEMEPYVTSYLEPLNDSAISKHNFTCFGCHSNTSEREARKAVLNEMERSILTKLTGVNLSVDTRALSVNCTKCHASKDVSHFIAFNETKCEDCHWAHMKSGNFSNKSGNYSNISMLPLIPYGPHKDQTCQKCHGTNFQIPKCINCHTGHGNQKLENRLCLVCHSDPHIPEIPGNSSGNTVEFKEKLPFSVCQPCHENQYFNIINAYSLHTEMQTCTLCHSSHGEKPRCSKCHEGMMIDRHKDFKCETCHATFVREKFISCMDCHGTSHEWSALTAIINPK